SRNGLDDMRRLHVHAADVVETAVVRLADERVDRPYVFVAGPTQRPADNPVDAGRDRQGVGEDDRRLDGAPFLDLCGPGKLAERVADEHGAGNLLLEQIAAVRHDRRDAGTDVVSFNQRHMPDAYTLDVRDRIEWTRRERARCDADVPRPGPRRLRIS